MSNRKMSQWLDMFASLRKPGDSLVVDVSEARAYSVLRKAGRPINQFIRAEGLKRGVRFVRLARPKNLTRQIAELKVGEELTMPDVSMATLATLATRVRREHPRRRYRTHHDRRSATFIVSRES